MLAKTYSYTIVGLEACLVNIEVDVHGGLPLTHIVGLPDNVIKESKERVKSAIKNSGFSYPLRRVTINLSPANLKKEGPAFELAMAVGILAADEQIDPETVARYALLGELSLDGSVKGVRGSLPIALGMDRERFDGLILPLVNAREAALNPEARLVPVEHLQTAVELLLDPVSIQPWTPPPTDVAPSGSKDDLDYAQVKGQHHAKRGLEIAAAGGHNVVMIGPPGCGKSMLAKRFPGILPDMTPEEAYETTKIHSVMNLLPAGEPLLSRRPFRTAHHTTSAVALVGGGTYPRPGEITLSHNGVLFLDELPEFQRNALEALRQPMEDHCVTIARANQTLRFPARFILLAAMNPCPCGYLTHPRKACQCRGAQVQRYLTRISGPLLDRIDIHLEIPPVPQEVLASGGNEETSARIKDRTLAARARQSVRFAETSTTTNAQMDDVQLRKHCRLDNAGAALLGEALEQLNLSARAHDKILRLSRTIADLAGAKSIGCEHLAEAIQFRSLDRIWGH
ncbi:MAG: YifB family Mg chelatase-like AAA ATPase [Candidatus Omnitrophica bacterium]|nr:YifB family Mg chelatase-like AAA ATPase [Candidatus Omnitrophota bacterium]MCB9720493.1 YifB family Mg chelatase-like AAA ATPase [Candidatus Omnitrophota bacterium]